MASSVRNRAVDPHVLLIGEVGLAGEIRAVPQLGKRLAEAARLGFQRAVAPKTDSLPLPADLEVVAVSTLSDALGGVA